jgi:glycerophosphoryl diester phosphodiesterase
MYIIGHRGAAGVAPENTLASFKEAVRLGSDWIEFDVRLSSDGVPVIVHDSTLKRTTNGRGPVRARSLAELRKLDAGSWFDPRFSSEKMPTLDEVLKLGARVRLNIEIKARSAPASEAARAVWSRVRQAGLEDRVLVTCFDLRVLRALRDLDSEARLAFPWQAGLRDPIRRATTLKCRMMLFDVGGLSEKKVRRCREVGLEVWVYTVNEPDEMRRVLDLGIDGLITDRPDLLARMVRREAALT